MIEVETKLSISNPEEIRKIAKRIGKYKGVEIKKDDYYTKENLSRYPKDSVRIRKVDGFYIYNFKERISYEEGVYAKNEIERKVKNIDKFLKELKEKGFKKWIRKEKRCELYEIKKNFHIELNFVKKLGWFVEVEYLVKNKSQIFMARKEVVKIVKELGFSEKDGIKTGYTKMLWNKMIR